MLIFHFCEFETIFNTAFNTRRKRFDLSKADDAIACGKDRRLLTTLNDLKTKTNCRCDQGFLLKVGSMTLAACHWSLRCWVQDMQMIRSLFTFRSTILRQSPSFLALSFRLFHTRMLVKITSSPKTWVSTKQSELCDSKSKALEAASEVLTSISIKSQDTKRNNLKLRAFSPRASSVIRFLFLWPLR